MRQSWLSWKPKTYYQKPSNQFVHAHNRSRENGLGHPSYSITPANEEGHSVDNRDVPKNNPFSRLIKPATSRKGNPIVRASRELGTWHRRRTRKSRLLQARRGFQRARASRERVHRGCTASYPHKAMDSGSWYINAARRAPGAGLVESRPSGATGGERASGSRYHGMGAPQATRQKRDS